MAAAVDGAAAADGAAGGGHSGGDHAPAHDNHHGPAGHPYHGPIYHGGPGYNHAYYGNWYHGGWHDHWVHPWHCGPVGWVGFGIGFGVGFGLAVWDAPWYWGYWPYYNPYCTEVIVVENTPIDYSRPIVVAAPAAQMSVASADTSAAQAQAAQYLDAARSAFIARRLPDGDDPSEPGHRQASQRRPAARVPRLVLFATRQYKPAAAAIYAVLSVGPGWDWSTLISLYPNPDVYTAQLRALEQYRNEHLTSPEVRFLLAYHYMSCGSNDAAAAELKEVVRLNPKDQLSAQLLAGLSGDKSPPKLRPPTAPLWRPSPSTPPAWSATGRPAAPTAPRSR